MTIIVEDANQVRVRVALRWDAKRGYHVDLPTASMIPGTFQPVVKNLLSADGPEPEKHPDGSPRASVAEVLALAPTVEVLMPAADVHPVTGKPSAAVIRERYRDHAKFAKDDYTPPVALTPTEVAEEARLSDALKKNRALAGAARIG